MKLTPLSSKDSASYAKKLKSFLKETGWSKAELAGYADMPATTIGAWLLGRNCVTVQGRDRLELALEELVTEMEKKLEAIDRFLA